VGDKDLSTATAVAVCVLVSAGPAVLDYSFQGVPDTRKTVSLSPQKRASSSTLTGAYSASGGAWSATDGVAVVTATLGGQVLTVFRQLNTVPVNYSPAFTNTVADDLMIASSSLSDAGVQVYNPPVIQEAPVANDDPLFVRYKLQRYYTVLNNAGIFSAQRYLSTDQIAAATQVFTNNAPLAAGDRTNILASGVGGDFRSTA